MQILTKERILKDTNWKAGLAGFGLFAFTGCALTAYPLLYLREISFNSLFGTGFMLVFLGIPFGYFFGIREIVKILKMVTQIRGEQYSVVEDVVTDKQMTDQTGNGNYCFLAFQNYSERTNKQVGVKRSVYSKTKRGDKFYLIFLEGDRAPLKIYSLKEFLVEGADK